MSVKKMYAAVLQVSDVFADFDRNPRDPERDYLDCEPTKGFDKDKYLAGTMSAGLFEDIQLNGVVTPISVVLLSEAQKATIFARTGRHYTCRVAKGHRRMYTVNRVNELFPGTITEVNALVYEGLTELEEWELLTDHSANRRETELSGIGVYRAVIKLHAAGFSQEKIGNMMGKVGRGYAQRHVNVFAMRNHTPIETHWLGIHLPKDDAKRPDPCFKLTNKNVDDLFPKFNADRSAGRDPMAIGSEFRKEWDTILTSGKSSADSQPKSMKRDDILTRKTFVEGRPALMEAMDFAANNGGNMQTAADLYDKLAEKAARADRLVFDLDLARAEVISANTTLASVNEALTSVHATVDTLTAERDALTAELASVKAERDALTAELASVKAERSSKKPAKA